MSWVWFYVGYVVGAVPAFLLAALVYGAPVNPFEGYDADKPAG